MFAVNFDEKRKIFSKNLKILQNSRLYQDKGFQKCHPKTPPQAKFAFIKIQAINLSIKASYSFLRHNKNAINQTENLKKYGTLN